MDGLILINKPKGITSFAVLSGIKKRLLKSRVGHTGTLDKFAEGLLLVLTGGLTRLASYFLELPKSYRAVICLGKETSTLDPEGEIVAEGFVPERAAMERVLKEFKGSMLQVPPQYSALHIKGKRAYHYALNGETAPLPARPITIFSSTLVDYTPPLLTLDICCSKGTYIRAIARDLGRKLGTCAYVGQLSRSAVGEFQLAAAVDPADFEPDRHLIPAVEFIRKISTIKCLTVGEQYEGLILNGAKIEDFYFGGPEIPQGLYALFTVQDRMLAMVNKTENMYRYELVVKE